MFNLIVCGAAWETGQFEFLAGRMFEHTPEVLIQRFRPAQGTDFNGLMQLPTLFMNEGQDEEVARVGRVTDVEVVNNRDISITCTFDGDIPGIQNRAIAEMAGELRLDDWEFSRNHWAVKQVDLFRALLRRNLRRRVGPQVFQIADHEAVQADLVSVMMPFAAGFRPVYTALQELCGDMGLRCMRGDDIWRNNMVMQDVVSLIDTSRVVIGDCSERNPNVFYEIGIAHTLGREVLLITQSHEDVPFNLRHLRYVPYANTAAGRRALAATLRGRIEALV